jgi:hypothetical protein
MVLPATITVIVMIASDRIASSVRLRPKSSHFNIFNFQTPISAFFSILKKYLLDLNWMQGCPPAIYVSMEIFYNKLV